MAKKTTKPTEKELVTLKTVQVTDLKLGDEIYLEKDENSMVYTVLDLGNPFILIEDLKHFAYLYRVVEPIYIKITNN